MSEIRFVANKTYECSVCNRNKSLFIQELIVQSMRYRTAQSKRKSHASTGNTERHFPIAKKDPQINLKADDEQEQNQPKVGYIVEDGKGCCREYGICKARYTADHRWAE